MNNLPLKPLVWFELESANRLICEVVTPICEYSVWKDVDSVAYSVLYYNRHTEAPTKEATGFATIDEAKAWAWNHYNEKMQPYVKPMPTKVYELTYDCGDSYSTIFMTLDKQQAVDFMESVKKHDEQFICDTSYDAYEVETIHDLYNDNHPLAPYKDEVFKSIYEDSFSEWMLNYGSNSFVSSLEVIDHELFSTMQNSKGE